MDWLKGIVAWLQEALETVYAKDGLVGVAAVVVLTMLVVAGLVWLLGPGVLGLVVG
jgi:hypothetical protein